MGERDHAEKELEMYEDVFADIVNVLLFNGEEIIEPENLSDAEPRSQYSGDGEMHEQERDVAKYWNESKIRLARLGIENQSQQDPDMVLRVFSYDGGAYREQLLKKPAAKGVLPDESSGSSGQGMEPDAKRYPVVTLVLHFDPEKRWEKAKRLKERVTVSRELDPYVNDYKMQVFDVPFLEREVIDRFHSDFKYVADYFWQMRTQGTYRGSKEKLQHAKAVMRMLSAVLKDHRFMEAYYASNREGDETMSKYVDQMFAAEVAKGKAEGRAEGRAESIISIMNTLHLTMKEAMNVLNIPPSDQSGYINMINERLSQNDERYLLS